jgi:MFS family permease
MGSGGFFSLQGSIVGQLVGSHRIDKAIGIIELIESVGFFAGPVTAGLLLDAFGGPEAGPAAYRPAMVSGRLLSRRTILGTPDIVPRLQWLVGGTSALAVAMAIRMRWLYDPKVFVKA